MKTKKVFALLFSFLTIFIFSSCDFESSKIVMPYGTEEYKTGEWTGEMLTNHLVELGFSFDNIEISAVYETYGDAKEGIYNIQIEDADSSSWFADYRKFEKGEEFDNSLKIKIETYVEHQTISVNNSTEFYELVQMEETPKKQTEISEFMRNHSGEYLEFDGIITDCYDDFFYVNFDLDFDVQIENSHSFEYSWNSIEMRDLHEMGWGYNYNTYSKGTLSVGDKVHMVCQIYLDENGWRLDIREFDSFKGK